MARHRRFKQVDVFSRSPFLGNPLAVVLEAEDLDTTQMQEIARWTGLSETVFVLPASDALADYRVRIFTPTTELPFAGHPTLGTAHAMLEQGLRPRTAAKLVQQCAAGLISVVPFQGRLAFYAPPAEFQTIVDDSHLSLLVETLGVPTNQMSTPTVVKAGISWLVVGLPSEAQCLGVYPDPGAMQALLSRVGSDGLALYAPSANASDSNYEVRALFLENGRVSEDPVTGSANACLARLRQSQGSALPEDSYRVRQGTAIGHAGEVFVDYIDGEPCIGGISVTLIEGTLFA